MLGVVNELLGTALSKLGPNPLLLAPSPSPPSRCPNGGGAAGAKGRGRDRILGPSLPPQTDEATTWRRSNGGVLGWSWFRGAWRLGASQSPPARG